MWSRVVSRDAAARLVEDVMPRVPVRQWVLSFPYEIRYRLAWDGQWVSAVLAVFLRVVGRWYRRQAQALGHDRARWGSVTFVQWFGSSLNLNPHLHVQDAPVFVPALPVSDRDVKQTAIGTYLGKMEDPSGRTHRSPISVNGFADPEFVAAFGPGLPNLTWRVVAGSRRSRIAVSWDDNGRVSWILIRIYLVSTREYRSVEMAAEEGWVDIAEVAAHLRVARDTVYRWVDTKGLPAHRVGRLLRFRLSEVGAWMTTGSGHPVDDGARATAVPRPPGMQQLLTTELREALSLIDGPSGMVSQTALRQTFHSLRRCIKNESH